MKVKSSIKTCLGNTAGNVHYIDYVSFRFKKKSYYRYVQKTDMVMNKPQKLDINSPENLLYVLCKNILGSIRKNLPDGKYPD